MSDTRRRQAISLINSVGYVQPRLGLVYMCAISSGGGTRYARLPPVIEIIPRSGYLIHCACCAASLDDL